MAIKNLVLTFFFCMVASLESRYIVGINSLRQLHRCLVIAEKPLWITSVKDILVRSKTKEPMEDDTVKYFNDIQQEVVATIGIESSDFGDNVLMYEKLRKSGITFNNKDFDFVFHAKKQLSFYDGILSGKCSNSALIMHYLLALRRNYDHDTEEVVVAVAHDYEALEIADFLSENYFPINCAIFLFNSSEGQTEDDGSKE
jgi:hypothetical protein